MVTLPCASGPRRNETWGFGTPGASGLDLDAAAPVRAGLHADPPPGPRRAPLASQLGRAGRPQRRSAHAALWAQCRRLREPLPVFSPGPPAVSHHAQCVLHCVPVGRPALRLPPSAVTSRSFWRMSPGWEQWARGAARAPKTGGRGGGGARGAWESARRRRLARPGDGAVACARACASGRSGWAPGGESPSLLTGAHCAPGPQESLSFGDRDQK